MCENKKDDILCDIFSILQIEDDVLKEKSARILQKITRGFLCRKKILPAALLMAKQILETKQLELKEDNRDGRINSAASEECIIEALLLYFDGRIIIPKQRMWYDILIYDYRYGWLPINIKITKTTNNDNVGNLAMCVYSYTNFDMSLKNKNTYTNGKMSRVLIKEIKNGNFNRTYKKDYYFIVINKENTRDIIINGLHGISHIKANSNNLPFQICWQKNRRYSPTTIVDKVSAFIKCLQQQKPSWKEEFIHKIRNLPKNAI